MLKSKMKFLGLCSLASMSLAAPAFANTAGYLGELNLTAATFCPRGSVEAQGQLKDTSQETALFSLYGDMYGGDGNISFAVPDLRGRIAMHTVSGTYQGLLFFQGDKWGSESEVLFHTDLPVHRHVLQYSDPLNSATPGNRVLGTFGAGANAYTVNSAADRVMLETGTTGAQQSFEIAAPTIAMRWCVNTVGLYPQRH